MLILGVESATECVGCSIGGHEGVIASVEVTRGRRHAETLAPAVAFCCERAGIALNDISVAAVDVGPGLFTGLRVGIATAKAIAHALRIPMIGLPSLDLLAFPLRYANRVICTVIDARRGELFYAFYRQVPGGVQRLARPEVGSVDDLVADIYALGDDVLCVGDGALRYRDALGEVHGVELADAGLAYPSSRPLVQLAHAKALREEWVKPWELEPLYLRKPDAEINWPTRAAR